MNIRHIAMLCIIVVYSPADIGYAETIGVRQFESCAVATDIDGLTDRRIVVVGCVRAESIIGFDRVRLLCLKDNRAVYLKAGIQIHLADLIEVAYRFDKGPLRRGNWVYNEGDALTIDSDIYQEFMAGITSAKTLHYKVGENRGKIDLTGGAKAVAEYRRRCKAMGYAVE